MSYLENVPLDQLEAHPRNVRRDLGDLTELADSIKGIGLLEPLVIAPKGKPGEGFVVIGGHRRLAAAAEAGLTGVPCILRADLCTPASQIEAMLTENLQRTDLTVMEEADAYEQLALLGVKDAAICRATGRSPKTVKERRLLASLPTPRREQFEKGQLSLDGAVKCGKLREKWAEDAEILELIDSAGTYAFGSAYGSVDSQIEHVLDKRKRAAEPEPDAADQDDDALDYSGRRAQQEAEWEQKRQAQAIRAQAVELATTRMYDWLSARVAVQAQTTIDGLMDWALDECIDNYDMDDAAPLVGIDPPGEDEDADDANLRIAAAVKALPHQDKVIALALAVSGAAKRRPYFFDEHARSMSGIGYALTDDDRALMKDDE